VCIVVGLPILMHKTSSSCHYLPNYLTIAAHTVTCDRMSKSLARGPVLPYPFSTTDEAHKNNLPASRATAAIATMFEFFEVAASTLFFA
jgi:hypothetical protein